MEKFVYPTTVDMGEIGKEFRFGISLREHFAGLAMQGLLSNPYYAEQQSIKMNKGTYDASIDQEVCCRSVELADALLKELEK